MFEMTMPKEHRDMMADFEVYTYSDVLYIMYVNGFYQGMSRTVPEIPSEGEVCVYEIDKANKTSTRVY